MSQYIPNCVFTYSFFICIFIALFIPEPVFDTRLFYSLQSNRSKTDTFWAVTKCPSKRESDKVSIERQGPIEGVR